MGIKVVLFDLDGTLLPMDQNVFAKAYFGMLAKKLATRGYEPNTLIENIWKGTAAMVKNDGSKKNEKAFWDTFVSIYGEKALSDFPYFEEFYKNDFDKIREFCGYTPAARNIVDDLKIRGKRVALATNPIFPSVATELRMKWAGLDKNDFELFTTYENSRYCKPNLKYYEDILTALGVDATECLMVGNDVKEDMIASELGMKVFLLTDCIINKDGADISVYPHGGFDALSEFLNNI